MRLRNLTLGYTLPANKIGKVTHNVLSSVRIYIAAENLVTITNYKGFDPEVSTLDAENGTAYIFRRGMDNFQLPQPRVIMAGIQIGF